MFMDFAKTLLIAFLIFDGACVLIYSIGHLVSKHDSKGDDQK